MQLFSRNYEEILQFHRNQPKTAEIEINDEAIFDLVSLKLCFKKSFIRLIYLFI